MLAFRGKLEISYHRGTSISGGRGEGGLDLTSSLEVKFGARSGQVHFEVISEIQKAKFGVFITYIFAGKIWGSNKNFRGKFWGQAPA